MLCRFMMYISRTVVFVWFAIQYQTISSYKSPRAAPSRSLLHIGPFWITFRHHERKEMFPLTPSYTSLHANDILRDAIASAFEIAWTRQMRKACTFELHAASFFCVTYCERCISSLRSWPACSLIQHGTHDCTTNVRPLIASRKRTHRNALVTHLHSARCTVVGTSWISKRYRS